MRRATRSVAWSYVLVFLWMIALYALSSLPGDIDIDVAPPSPIAWVPPVLQNLLHLPAYALLGWLWFRALANHRWSPSLILFAAFILASLYGAFDELHQMYVPGRFATLTDLAANVIGSAMGAGFAMYRHNTRAKIGDENIR